MATKPVEVTAVLRDLFTGPSAKVAAAADEIAKRIVPLQGVLRGVDGAIGSLASSFSAATSSVARAGQAITAVGSAVAKQYPNITKAVTSIAGAAKTAVQAVGGFAWSVVSAAGRAVSAVTSLRTAVAALLVGFVAGRTVGALRETAEALDDLGAASRRTGVAVETLSKLRVAAKLSNIEFGTLARSLGFLNRSLGSGSDEVRKTLDSLGISQQRLRSIKDASELLPDIADGLERLGDAQRATAAQSLFGRGGFEILALFEGGSSKLRAALADVDRFQLGLTSSQVNAADDLTDAIDRVGFAWEKVKASIIEAIGPGAVSLLNAFTLQLSRLPGQISAITSAIELAGGSNDAADEARDVLRGLASAFVDFVLDGSVAIGKTIADTFIGAIAIGIAALTPVFSSVFRDAIGPVLNNIPGINIAKSPGAQRREAEASLGLQGAGQAAIDAKRIELEANVEAARRRLQDLQRSLDVLSGDIQGVPTEKKIAEAVGINTLLDEKEAAILAKEKADNALRALNRLAALRAASDAETESVIREFSDQVKRFTEDAKANGDDLSKISKKFSDALSGFAARAENLRSPSDSAPAAPAQERPRAPVLSDEQKKNREETLQNIELQRLRALGLDQEAALLEIQVAKLRAAADAEKNYGAAASDTLRQLSRLADVQSKRVRVDFAVKDVTAQLQQIEKSYSDTLRNNAALVEAGNLTQAEASEANKRAADQAAAAIVALQEQLTAIALQFPQFQSLLKDVREDAARARTEIETPPKKLSGWGDQLFEIRDQVKNFVQAVANNLADGVVGALEAIVEGTKSVGDAFRDLAVDVLKSAAQMIIKLLVLMGIVLALQALGVPPQLLGLTKGLNHGGMVGRDERILGFSDGGQVPGRGPNRDTVPARLTRGEIVIRRDAVDLYGSQFLLALNSMAIPRDAVAGLGAGTVARGLGPSFNQGGTVSGPTAASAPIAAYIVSSNRAVEDFLNGGESAVLRFLIDHKGQY